MVGGGYGRFGRHTADRALRTGDKRTPDRGSCRVCGLPLSMQVRASGEVVGLACPRGCEQTAPPSGNEPPEGSTS